jgi:hypothetical protein
MNSTGRPECRRSAASMTRSAIIRQTSGSCKHQSTSWPHSPRHIRFCVQPPARQARTPSCNLPLPLIPVKASAEYPRVHRIRESLWPANPFGPPCSSPKISKGENRRDGAGDHLIGLLEVCSVVTAGFGGGWQSVDEMKLPPPINLHRLLPVVDPSPLRIILF